MAENNCQESPVTLLFYPDPTATLLKPCLAYYVSIRDTPEFIELLAELKGDAPCDY